MFFIKVFFCLMHFHMKYSQTVGKRKAVKNRKWNCKFFPFSLCFWYVLMCFDVLFFFWCTGVLEWWSVGVLETKNIFSILIDKDNMKLLRFIMCAEIHGEWLSFYKFADKEEFNLTRFYFLFCFEIKILISYKIIKIFWLVDLEFFCIKIQFMKFTRQNYFAHF